MNPSPNIFIDLRKVLTNLYPSEYSIRRIVDDAGLDSRQIGFGSSPINVWHFVLMEAEKVGRVEALLRVVESEGYGNNREFQVACQAYRQAQGKSENVNLHSTVSTHQPKTYPKPWQQRLLAVLVALALLGFAGGGAYWMLGGLRSGGNVTPTSTAVESASAPSEGKSVEGSSTPAELPTSTLTAVLPSSTSIAIATTTVTAPTPTVSIPQLTNTPAKINSALCSFAFLVLDEQSEEPIRRATIAVFVGVRQDTGTTDSTGYYLAHLSCSNEQVVEARLRVSADDYKPYNRSVFLSNETTEIFLERKETLTPTTTSTATFTPMPTLQPTATATPTPLPTLGYPCDAKTTSKSNVKSIRLLVSPAGGVREETIPTGVNVQILKSLKDEGLVEIWYDKEQVGGWVYDENLVPSDLCPK
jgi:hypothetical protein